MAILFLKSSKYRLNYVPNAGPASRWRILACLTLVLSVSFSPASGQRSEPSGIFLNAGLAAASGAGLEIGVLKAGDFFTREILFLTDVLAVIDPDHGNNQVVLMMGGSLRLFGFERTIGNVPYRGYDIDVGFRVGPGLSFAEQESRSEKNRRFNLFLEPYVRLSLRTRLIDVLFLEVGTTIPRVRFGSWIQL